MIYFSVGAFFSFLTSSSGCGTPQQDHSVVCTVVPILCEFYHLHDSTLYGTICCFSVLLFSGFSHRATYLAVDQLGDGTSVVLW